VQRLEYLAGVLAVMPVLSLLLWRPIRRITNDIFELWHCIWLRSFRSFGLTLAYLFLFTVGFWVVAPSQGSQFGDGIFIGVLAAPSIDYAIAFHMSPKVPPGEYPKRWQGRPALLTDWAAGALCYVLYFLTVLWLYNTRGKFSLWLHQRTPVLAHRVEFATIEFLIVFIYTTLVSNVFLREIAQGLDDYWDAPRRLQYELVIIPIVIVMPIFYAYPGAIAGLGWHVLLFVLAWWLTSTKPAGTLKMIRNILSKRMPPPITRTTSRA
jgi:hypothetical protein